MLIRKLQQWFPTTPDGKLPSSQKIEVEEEEEEIIF
jgi:hypothetical protein